jgi:hypothetical protein
MVKDLNSLVTEIDQTRKEMSSLIKDTDPKLEICPGWTIKEVVGHITAWEIVIHKALLAFQAGDPPFFLHEQDFDLFNQAEVEKRTGWSFEKVQEEYQSTRNKLKTTISKLKEEDLDQELVLPWGSERTIRELIEIIAEHEDEHRDAVVKKKC